MRRNRTEDSEVDIKLIKRDKSSPSSGRECDLERAEREAEEKKKKKNEKNTLRLRSEKLAGKRQKVAP